MKYNILILMSLLFLVKMEAQNKKNEFNLKVEVPSQSEQIIYLGQYWKGNTYAIDSVKLDKKGKGHLSSPNRLDEGQYFLHIKPNFTVDVLIGNEQDNIELSIAEGNLLNNKVKGSRDTQILWEYLYTSKSIDEEKDKLNKKLGEKKDLTEPEINALKQQLTITQDKEELFTNEFIKKNQNTWASAFIKGLQPIKLPHPIVKTKEEFEENRKYGKEHFFDNINLTDPRFWRTNYFIGHIDNYMKQWVEANFDSLAYNASKLVAKTEGNDFCFKEMLSKLMNESLASKVMGDENIWMKLFEDYVQDKNVAWITPEQMSELKKMYEYDKNCRIGSTAHNLKLNTINGDSINTNQIDAQYTLLYFYDPGCGHCRTEMPSINEEVYKKYKDKGLKIVAININVEPRNWEGFVKEKGLEDWINCADLEYKSQYWMYYNTSGVPSTFLLDKNKTIIAKRIDKNNLLKILGYYIKE